MSTKKKAKTKHVFKPVPYVLKENYVSGVVAGQPFQLSSTHPTFERMKKALRAKEWAKIPKLVSAAQNIAAESQGNVVVKKGKVFFKGTEVHDALSQRIVEIVKENKPISHMIKFMDNLRKNPSEAAQNELYDWLKGCRLPITDDGCFVAYKAVNNNYTDCHTGKIDNSVGQVVTMPRSAVDANRRNECSTGLHFCSRAYLSGFGGQRIMKLKINPKDVVAIPADYHYTKGRTWRYEVIGEVSYSEIEHVKNIDDISEFMTSVVPIAASRQELLKKLLALPAVKKAIKGRKMKKSSLEKQSFGRLEKTFRKLVPQEMTVSLSKEAKVLQSPLKAARIASGLTVRQVATRMGLDYKTVAKMEQLDEPSEKAIDNYLTAVAKLMNVTISRSAISYPEAVAKN